MVRLIKKDRLSNKNESKYYIKEGKQVGTLYHVCTLDALVEYIIPKDELSSSEKYWNPLLKTNKQVSFTRDKLFVVPTWTVGGADILFQFVIDGDKLSDRYKITPFNGNISSDKRTNPKKFEKEEVVIGPIKNFKSYIKEVYFDIKNNYLDEGLLIYLKIVKKYLGSIKCTRTTLPFIKDDWSISYKKTKNEFDLYKIKTLDDLISNLEKYNPDYIDTEDLFDKALFNGFYEIRIDSLNKVIKEHPSWINDKKITKLALKTLSSDYINIFKFCVENGFDINKEYKSIDGKTPLYYACEEFSNEIIEYLLDHGADPNIVWKENHTPLSVILDDKSPYNSTVKILKSLFKHGARITESEMPVVIKNYISSDAYSFVGKSDIYLEILDLILENGLDVNAIDKETSKPLILLAKDSFVVSALLEHDADPNIKYEDIPVLNYTLHEKYINSTRAEWLVRYKADVNYLDIKGYTPLLLTLEYHNDYFTYTFAGFLLEHGADPNIKNKCGDTPLYAAFSYDHGEESEKLINLLLDHGADVNAVASRSGGQTILHIASRYNECLPIVKTLVKHNAEVNVKNQFDSTPLSLACWKGCTNIVKYLLEHGANPYIKDDSGKLPMDIAKTQEIKDILQSYMDNWKGER